MFNSHGVAPEYSDYVAHAIKQQIGFGGLLTLGAHNFHTIYATPDFDGGLKFTALILPFKGSGERSIRPRKMMVRIVLEHTDTYKVRVSYYKKQTTFLTDEVVHFEGRDIYAHHLEKLAFALDYDGEDSVTNPRFWGVVTPTPTN